ncbi:ATP-dependent DNA helicase RRM3-like protein, partial [Tanacetum coccineum]
TPFQDVTPVGSLTFKSRILNGIDLDETVGDTATKGKSIRDKHASRFMNQTPVNFNIESPSTEQVRVSSIQSSVLTSDRKKLKDKMVTRQSTRRINFSESVHKVDKKDHGHKFVGISKDYIDHGDPTFECSSCDALLWYAESMGGSTNASSDSYSLCCSRGKVSLTNEVVEPPPLLKELITNKHPKSGNFLENIRRYNSMFAFTSMGGKQDTSVNVGRGPYCYLLRGENYHLAGPLLPETGKPAKFAQLYIFDTENEIQNRISTVRYNNGEGSSSRNNELDYKLTTDIRDFLRLIGTRQRDGRQYNLPTTSEVAALIVGDFDSTEHKRVIILQCQDDDFKRINELHPSYLALHYPLFYITERDNYRTVVYTIEFQKRGLPHCHILLWLEAQDKLTTTGKIDKYISSEMPNKDDDTELYQLITDHMMHGPCGADNPMVMQFIKEEMMGVPLRKARQICTMVGSIKYLFKYINKGPDRVSATIDGEEVDEIKDYLNCRYLSACEAAWRIYGFDIHYRTPSVERLPFHLKDEQQVILMRQKALIMRLTNSMSRPEVVWEKTWTVIAADVLNIERIKQKKPGLELSDSQRKNICLTYIECILRSNNMSLKDIQNMSYPAGEYMMVGYNRLIFDETSYDQDKLKEQHVKLYGSLTFEQKDIYSTVIDAIDNEKCGMFFMYGYDGTKKTYLYKIMSSALRSKGKIVLNVASSGIAALLLEGGRTAHSRFTIPINVVEDSMCHIGADSDLADLIRKAKLIIWDEAPMVNRHYYEAFDRTLCDIFRTDPTVASDKVFGGKVVLFSGDFR